MQKSLRAPWKGKDFTSRTHRASARGRVIDSKGFERLLLANPVVRGCI